MTERPLGVTILGILWILNGLMWLVAAFLGGAALSIVGLGALGAVIGVILFIIGIIRHLPWNRLFQGMGLGLDHRSHLHGYQHPDWACDPVLRRGNRTGRHHHCRDYPLVPVPTAGKGVFWKNLKSPSFHIFDQFSDRFHYDSSRLPVTGNIINTDQRGDYRDWFGIVEAKIKNCFHIPERFRNNEQEPQTEGKQSTFL